MTAEREEMRLCRGGVDLSRGVVSREAPPSHCITLVAALADLPTHLVLLDCTPGCLLCCAGHSMCDLYGKEVVRPIKVAMVDNARSSRDGPQRVKQPIT